jgi:hypothetical protein
MADLSWWGRALCQRGDGKGSPSNHSAQITLSPFANVTSFKASATEPSGLRHTTSISSGRAVLVSSLTMRDSKLRMFVSLRSVLCNPFFDRRTNPRQHCNAAAEWFAPALKTPSG